MLAKFHAAPAIGMTSGNQNKARYAPSKRPFKWLWARRPACHSPGAAEISKSAVPVPFQDLAPCHRATFGFGSCCKASWLPSVWLRGVRLRNSSRTLETDAGKTGPGDHRSVRVRPHAYGFFMIVCGPIPLRERMLRPEAALAITTGGRRCGSRMGLEAARSRAPRRCRRIGRRGTNRPAKWLGLASNSATVGTS
jgi:hypothetical protein